MKIVYGYSYFASEYYDDAKKMNDDYLDRLRQDGFDVEGYCLTIDPPGPPVAFSELDKMWKAKDPKLMKFYDDLREALIGKDVLMNASGINLHPEFVESLKDIFTVFQCFDDPESSEFLSKPVANSYDLCLVGNIAEVGTYKTWGVKNAEWVPMGVLPEIYDPSLTYEQIIEGERDIDLFMMINYTHFRKERLDKILKAFPNADFYGVGFPKGPLTKDRVDYLKRSKIGPNMHNSTGPINYRTFYLPANGVMQICDNKKHLGDIYELNKEVVGFDTMEECIDLCRYYLAHDDERRKIAAEGWKRCLKDYTEVAIFRRNVSLFEKYMKIKEESSRSIPYKLKVKLKRIFS
ncbi:MAG: glycosyltransferase family 1 protein [Candidatus Doudnabacteria bacterium]|nr:glycosyltransferase family 1 protein [Candidatus Doudnabacteria bacterium]